YAATSAFQKRKDGLRRGIGLRQRRQRGLLENLRFRQVRGFSRYVGITNAGLRSRVVGDLGLREIHRVIQFVHACADAALYETEIGDRRTQQGKRTERARSIGSTRGRSEYCLGARCAKQ